MADPAPDLPAGGGHGPAGQVLAADVQARLELLQGDLLPVHGEGEQEGLDVRQAQAGLHDEAIRDYSPVCCSSHPEMPALPGTAQTVARRAWLPV